MHFSVLLVPRFSKSNKSNNSKGQQNGETKIETAMCVTFDDDLLWKKRDPS